MREGRHLHYTPQLTMTPHRIKILSLAAEGLNQHEIGERLCISPQTVKNNLCVIHEILQAQNTAHAIYIACKRGLI